MFFVSGVVNNELICATEFPTINDALRYASVLGAKYENDVDFTISKVCISNNSVMENTKKEKVKQLTNNERILNGFELSLISDNNLEPFVRTLEAFYEKYMPKDYKYTFNSPLNGMQCFLFRCFWDDTPELRDDITLNQIYDYFVYVTENNKKDIMDWGLVFKNAFRIFGKNK